MTLKRSWYVRSWYKWKCIWFHNEVVASSMASNWKLTCLCCFKQPLHVLCMKMVLDHVFWLGKATGAASCKGFAAAFTPDTCGSFTIWRRLMLLLFKYQGSTETFAPRQRHASLIIFFHKERCSSILIYILF